MDTFNHLLHDDAVKGVIKKDYQRLQRKIEFCHIGVKKLDPRSVCSTGSQANQIGFRRAMQL